MSDAPRKEIQRPKGDDDFEDLALALFRALWQDPNAKLHSRPGQGQHGVDLYGEDRFGRSGLTGVQCKHHGSATLVKDKDLVAELKAEVDKAKKFQPPLQRFIFATTARRSVTLQQEARDLTELHRKAGLFAVDVLGWQDLEDLLRRHSDVLDWYLGDRTPQGEVPGVYRCMAPAQESFVERSEYVKIRDALFLDKVGRSDSGMTTTVGIHGAGGFGKTALAIELCYDPRIRERFPDGILWAQMRDNLDDNGRLKEIRDVIRLWTREEPPAFETIAKAGKHLIELLNGKRVLLVVDDVWHHDDVSPFQGLAALLVTTRDRRTLPADSVPIHVDAMEIPEAVQLLDAGLPAGAEAELKTLAALLGEWPLLLKIVNRQVASWISKGLDFREAIHRAENTLKARGLTYFDPKDAQERSQASALTLEVSLERLSPDEQKRFAELAVFPEDTNVPLAVLEKLWPLDPLDVEELASRLSDLSLLRNFDLRSGTIRLHDVIRGYLLKRGESHLPEWHQRLLDASRPASGGWPDLPRDESYLWNHLVHHLIGAGQGDICRALLLDFHYLRSKLSATDINALLADYAPFTQKDKELWLVRDALRLSAHVLARNPEEFRGQLWGRLLDRQEAGIQGFLQESDSSDTPWLRLRNASLAWPGGALIRTIDHPGKVTSLAVLPDGRAVSGSYDGILRLWDLESGQTLQVFKGHSNSVHALAVLDSRRVVFCFLPDSFGRTLGVLDMESDQTVQVLEGHPYSVSAVAALDSHHVVSGSIDGTLRVWDVESGQTLQMLKGQTHRIRAMVVLDSRRVVSGSNQGTLRVWDIESGQTQTLKGHSDEVNAVAVLDSRRMISGSVDGTLRVWDMESGQTLQILKGQTHQIHAAVVLDSRRVVSGSRQGPLQVWDVESGQTQTLEAHSDEVNAMAVLDSRRVVSGSDDGTLRVWDVGNVQTRQSLEGYSGRVKTVAMLDSHRVVSGSHDGTLRVWDVESGQTLQSLKGYHWVNAVTALDSYRVVAGSYDGLRVWNLESGQILQLKGHYASVNAVAVLDSRRVVSGSSDTTLRVWDVESGQTLQTLEGHPEMVSAVVVLDSRRVVSSSFDTLYVWDVERGQILRKLKGYSSRVDAMAVLGSNRVISCSYNALHVWDVENGRTLQSLEGHHSWVKAVAVLDSRRAISGSDDRTLRVWDVESGKVESLFTLDAPVTAVAVIPDRRVIVAGDHTGHVHFFDLVEP